MLENQKKKGCATLVRRRRNYVMFRFSTKNRRHNTIKCCNEIIICNQSIWLNYQDNSFISIYKSVWLISAVSVYQIARQGGEKFPTPRGIDFRPLSAYLHEFRCARLSPTTVHRKERSEAPRDEIPESRRLKIWRVRLDLSRPLVATYSSSIRVYFLCLAVRTADRALHTAGPAPVPHTETICISCIIYLYSSILVQQSNQQMIYLYCFILIHVCQLRIRCCFNHVYINFLLS